jgi:8-oxo-dGTP diphosphatase
VSERPDPANHRPEPAGLAPEILARGPWALERVTAHWQDTQFEPSAEQTEAANAAIRELQERGSPSHDGVGARLVDFRQGDEEITIELQPLRWALRLVDGDASQSMAALCVTRAADGRWLAGRRAPWVASWAGRWALGAGGAVDLGENPTETLVRELNEEWAVSPERVRGEALLRLPHRLVMFVGQAWLADGVEETVAPDHEHDEFAWWPRDIAQWPPEAGEALPRVAQWLSQ